MPVSYSALMRPTHGLKRMQINRRCRVRGYYAAVRRLGGEQNVEFCCGICSNYLELEKCPSFRRRSICIHCCGEEHEPVDVSHLIPEPIVYFENGQHVRTITTGDSLPLGLEAEIEERLTDHGDWDYYAIVTRNDAEDRYHRPGSRIYLRHDNIEAISNEELAARVAEEPVVVEVEVVDDELLEMPRPSGRIRATRYWHAYEAGTPSAYTTEYRWFHDEPTPSVTWHELLEEDS